MGLRTKISLVQLREIGWSAWDPIGLMQISPDWRDGGDDEYDSYILQIVGELSRGGSEQLAIAYLIEIERDHMGLGFRADTSDRAHATVKAIKEYLATLPKVT